MHAEFGIPKITINGETTYQVPNSYLNLARRLGQQPLTVIDEAGTETIVAKELTKPATEEPVKTQEKVETKKVTTDENAGKTTDKGAGKEDIGTKPKEDTGNKPKEDEIKNNNNNVEASSNNINLNF